MSRRFFLKLLLSLGLGNFFPKLAAAHEKILRQDSETSSAEKFQMLVFADSQCVDYGVWQRVVDAAQKNFPEARLATVIGDLVDNGQADYQWKAWFSAAAPLLEKIFLPVIGNHECYSLEWKNCLPEGYLRRFKVPPVEEKQFDGYFYSFDFGAANFFVLNNNFPELEEFFPDLREVQENWFRREVERSSRAWKIVLMHKDIFDYSQGKFNELGEIFMPLFDELKIDLVLTAHLHTYRNRGKIFAQKKSSEGICYVMCGRAGDQKYIEPSSEIDEVTAPSLPGEFETESFIVLDVEEKNLTLTCLGVGGEIWDKFTLRKIDVDKEVLYNSARRGESWNG